MRLSALTLDSFAKMPQPTIRTNMLDDLAAHHRSIRQRRFRYNIAEIFSDLSESGDSDSSHFSSGSPLSPISIDTPDIHISSDISMRSLSDDGHDTSSISFTSDSEGSIADFEVEYFFNWRRRYRELLHYVTTTRVLLEGPPIPKSSQLDLLEHWRVHSPDRFRRKLRVEPGTFDCLVRLIEDNPVFSNDSNCPQLPVDLQLKVFLFRAGHYGNAASPEDTAQWVGLSVGGVEKCTDRVVVALLSHHDAAIHFPNTDEKEAAKAFVEECTCPEWRDGSLVVDGTKFALFQRPGLHGDAWFDKDGEYSISCQVRRDII
jgi:hypothetical protein